MSDLFLDYKVKFPNIELFRSNYQEIKNEYLKVQNLIEFKDFTKQQNAYIKQNRKGYPINSMSYFSAKDKQENVNGWHVAALSVNGNFYPKNIAYLPILTETIHKIGNVCACGINILDPETSLDWHNDAEYSTQKKSFRSLWVLDCEEENCIMQLRNDKTGLVETRNFKNNEVYSFYHSTTHRVENLSTKPRIAVAFDISINGSEAKYDW
jgi:aspartyl/asparaginyl beta-hydroxylase (cupin superfamily)